MQDMLFVVLNISEKFVIGLVHLFLDGFVVLFTKARTDATVNDSLQSVSVVGRREAPP